MCVVTEDWGVDVIDLESKSLVHTLSVPHLPLGMMRKGKRKGKRKGEGEEEQKQEGVWGFWEKEEDGDIVGAFEFICCLVLSSFLCSCMCRVCVCCAVQISLPFPVSSTPTHCF